MEIAQHPKDYFNLLAVLWVLPVFWGNHLKLRSRPLVQRLCH